MLTDRPTALHRDNLGRLHHDDGPALSYPDGWAMHAWRGMPIPPDLAGRLAGLTVEEIRAEANAEIRRVMLEYFGFDRYLRESQAVRLHEDESGILWRVDMPGDEPLVMVEVINAHAGAGRYPAHLLPAGAADRQDHRGGVAWTFNLSEEEYAPMVQT